MWRFPTIVSRHRSWAVLTCMPVDLARHPMQQQARLQHCLLDLLQRPGVKAVDQLMHALRDCIGGLLALPFDLARVQHAAGVCAGALPRSLLEATRFEQQLVAMERLTLGPMARSV
jgi:hypothetical protein